MRLYRAHDDRSPWFGPGSWWAETEAHARRYVTMAGFGGPALYVAEVAPVRVLRLGRDPWQRLGELGFDRADYGAGELDHDIVASLAPALAASGYIWVILPVQHLDGWHDEWLYLAGEPVNAGPS